MFVSQREGWKQWKGQTEEANHLVFLPDFIVATALGGDGELELVGGEGALMVGAYGCGERGLCEETSGVAELLFERGDRLGACVVGGFGFVGSLHVALGRHCCDCGVL